MWDLLRVDRELTSLGGHTAEQYIINSLEITILKCELSRLPRLLCKNIKGAFAKIPSLPQILQTSEGRLKENEKPGISALHVVSYPSSCFKL